MFLIDQSDEWSEDEEYLEQYAEALNDEEKDPKNILTSLPDNNDNNDNNDDDDDINDK